MAMYPCLSLPSLSFPSVSGAVCSFDSQYAGLPLKSCVTQISGYQEGTGTPSPNNERPLHAWSAANLTHNGKNELITSLDIIKSLNTAGTWNNNIYVESNVTFTVNTNGGKVIGITINGTASADVYFKINGYLLKRGTSKKLNGTPVDGSPNNIRLGFQGFGYVRTAGGDLEILRTESQSDWNNWVYIEIKSGYQANNLTFNPMIRDVSEIDNTFEPYFNTSATFTFGQSIYQGSIDWKRGVVVGTMIIVNLGDLTWGLATNEGRIQSSAISDILPITSSTTVANINCSRYKSDTARHWHSVTEDNIIAECGGGYGGDKTIGIVDSTLANKTASDVKTAMNGVMLAYELATPIEIPLGGINLLTQEGQNNIFADTGDTTLQYIKLG